MTMTGQALADREANAVQCNKNYTIDTCIAMILRYIGATDGKYAVETNGDITLEENSAADTTVGLPTLDGTIDMSDAGTATLHIVVTNINESANWEAVLVDADPTWDPDAIGADAGNGILLAAEAGAPAAGNVNTVAGQKIFLDSSELVLDEATDAFVFAASIGIEHLTDEFGSILSRGNMTQLEVNPDFSNIPKRRSELTSAVLNTTAVAQVNTFRIYKIDTINGTSELIWSEAGAATAVDFKWPGVTQEPFQLNPGEKLLVVYVHTIVATAASIQVRGKTWKAGLATGFAQAK
jgi:hypothetical protein